MPNSSNIAQQAAERPLLSICLPVYNGAEYLPNVLSALLPQSDKLQGLVEVIVADDASSDDSQRICQQEADAGRLKYIRNSPNLGMGPNIARCITTHATGRFVWIWSQHCLLRPEMLRTLIDRIQQSPEIDVFYTNFRCARYPEKWPAEVFDGYDGDFDYVSNPHCETEIVSSWQELLSPETGLCTQTYAHIVLRERAARFLEEQTVQRDFGPAIATFTQTTVVASTFFHDRALYIGEPVFTIFNGAQTWSKLETRARVYFQALPELVRVFRSQGLSGDRLRNAERLASEMASKTLSQILLEEDRSWASPLVRRYAMQFSMNSGCISGLREAMLSSDWCLLARCLRSAKRWTQRIGLYLFFQCRPARWLHSRKMRRLSERGETECSR